MVGLAGMAAVAAAPAVVEALVVVVVAGLVEVVVALDLAMVADGGGCARRIQRTHYNAVDHNAGLCNHDHSGRIHSRPTLPA